VLLVTSVATVAVFRQPIADRVIHSQFRELGLTPAEFIIARFDFGAFELAQLRIGDSADLEVASLEIRYSAAALLSGRFDSLRIEGLRIRGTIDEAGLSLGALSPLLGGDAESDAAAEPTAIPFAHIELDDARIILNTEDGPLEATLSAQISESAEGELETSVDLSASFRAARLTAQLTAAGSLDSIAGDVKLDTRAAGQWAATTLRGASISTTARFTFEDGVVSIQPEGCVAVHVESLAVKNVLEFIEPLDFCLQSNSETPMQIFSDGAIETDFKMTTKPIDVELLSAEGNGLRMAGELPTLRVGVRQGETGLEV
jgi:hypothetical protein